MELGAKAGDGRGNLKIFSAVVRIVLIVIVSSLLAAGPLRIGRTRELAAIRFRTAGKGYDVGVGYAACVACR